MEKSETIDGSNRPTLPESNRERVPLRGRDLTLGFIGPLIAFLAMAVYLWQFSIDDVYISFRYADHLAAGDGLTWNTGGQPVEGFSNFLWVLILSAFRWLGADTETASKVLGMLLGGFNLWLLFSLIRKVWYPHAYWWLPVTLVALTPEYAMWTMSGLEIALFSTMMLLAVYALTCHSQRRVWLLTLSAAGLVLVRPEGVALGAVAVVWGWVSSRGEDFRSRLRTYGVPVLALATVSAGLLAFRVYYFGYPLPNTVYAKAGDTLPSLSRVLEWVVFGIPFLGSWALAVRFRHSIREQWALAAGISLVVAQMLLVLPVNPVMYFMHRYQIAFLPLLVLVVPFSLREIAQRWRWLGWAATLLLVVWSLQGWPEVYERNRAVTETMEKQREVVEYLVGLPGNPSVALCDAGRIPYWSDLLSHDVFGLCDSEWAHSGFSVPSLLGRSPSVYVMSANETSENQLMPFLGHDNLVMMTPAFRQRYGLGKLFGKREGELEGDYGYAVFINVLWAREHALDISPLERVP